MKNKIIKPLVFICSLSAVGLVYAESYKVTLGKISFDDAPSSGSEPWVAPVGVGVLHPNGVTVVCKGMTSGETFDINGNTYHVVYGESDAQTYGSLACTSNMTDMSYTFYGLPFNQDVSSWDVSSVTTMYEMFAYTSFNQDISSWDVSSVTEMAGMFSNTPFNQDISSWDVSSVNRMDLMFSNTPFNQDISGWDVSSVTIMGSMFEGSSFNQEICGWNVSNVTNHFLFKDGSSLLDANAPKFSGSGWGSNCP